MSKREREGDESKRRREERGGRKEEKEGRREKGGEGGGMKVNAIVNETIGGSEKRREARKL